MLLGFLGVILALFGMVLPDLMRNGDEKADVLKLMAYTFAGGFLTAAGLVVACLNFQHVF